jgi:2',3'-cyclic-nucleotide 2'-phosphodiesterase/3'-nucleotidase
VGGIRVGVVGLTTPATAGWVHPARWAGTRFAPPVDAARRAVERLRTAERCDVVVLLAHTGFARDPVTGDSLPGQATGENWGGALARDVPGVDVLILGHTHRVVPSAVVNGTLCTQAGRWAEHVGRVDLALERGGSGGRWRVVGRQAGMAAMDGGVPPDSGVVRLLAPARQRTDEALEDVVAVAEGPLSWYDGRQADSPLWQLVHQAQLGASDADVSLATLPQPAVHVPAGPFRVRDLLRLFPYESWLVVVELSGAELRETLEHAATCYAPYRYTAGSPPLVDASTPGDRYVAAYGVSYEIDLTQPPGERIVNLRYHDAPLEAEQRLRVVTDSYRASGAGGYAALGRAPRLWSGARSLRDLVAELLRRRGTLPAAFQPCWSILPDFALRPERASLDRLVRVGVLGEGEQLHLWPGAPATRGDFCYWLAKAFDWRERKLSGAFPDIPDSLAPWLDGLLRRRVLGTQASLERFRPFAALSPTEALDWAVRAARAAGYALPLDDAAGMASFRRSLLAGVARDRPGEAMAVHATERAGADPLVALGEGLDRAQALAVVANLRFPVVRLLETTDFHGALLPGARERGTGRPWGGSAVLAAYVDSLRRENPEGTVLLDGGDLFQGTMISNLQFGRPVVEQMNALGYTAAALGNHELDWGVDTLAHRIAELRAAVLGANVVERRSGRRPWWARRDTTIQRRGVRIAVLGVATPLTPTITLAPRVAGLDFLPPAPILNERIPRLRRAGASIVAVVGHIPGTVDSLGNVGGDLAELARETRDEDVVMGGHSHNRVLARVDGVPVLIAGAQGQAVGVVDLVVDPMRRRVIERDARLVATYADVLAPDTAMADRVERWNAPVRALAATPLGRNDTLLVRDRGGESPIGNLVTDAMRRAVAAEVALQNPGGLRADLPAGVVTRGTLYEVVPLDNTIVEMQLTGDELREALEEGLAQERVTQVSGLRYRFDLGRPVGSRVTELLDQAGEPVGPARVYAVLCNDFMAEGGDGYTALTRGRNRRDTGLTVRGALEDYVTALDREGRPLSYRREGRATPAR